MAMPARPGAAMSDSGQKRSNFLVAALFTDGDAQGEQRDDSRTGFRAYPSVLTRQRAAGTDQCDSAVSSMSALEAAGSSDASASI